MDQKSKIGEHEVLLIVSAVPAVAYWLAYLYQYGYCTFYEIPTIFIEVNLKETLVCVLWIILFFFFLSGFSDATLAIFRKIPNVVKSKLRIATYTVFLSTAISFSLKLTLFQFSISVLPALIGIIIYEFIVPLITHKKYKTYINKLEQAQQDDFANESSIDSFAKKIGSYSYTIFFFVFTLSVLAIFLGSLSGYLKIDYMISSARDKIVLKMYDSKFLTAKYNSNNNSYQLLFELIDTDKIGQFHYEKITALKLQN